MCLIQAFLGLAAEILCLVPVPIETGADRAHLGQRFGFFSSEGGVIMSRTAICVEYSVDF